MREFVLDGAEAAFSDDDGFGEAVLGAAAIGVDEELEEAEASFQGGGTVAQGSFDRVPEGEVRVNDGEDADAEEPFAGSASFAEPGKGAEVEDGDEQLGEEADALVVDVLVEGGVIGFDVEFVPAERDVQAIDRNSFVGEDFRVAPGAEEDAEEKDCDDEGGIEEESEGATPEGSEFDAVELLQPLGLACGEVAHADECTGLVCYAGFVP